MFVLPYYSLNNASDIAVRLESHSSCMSLCARITHVHLSDLNKLKPSGCLSGSETHMIYGTGAFDARLSPYNYISNVILKD